MPEKDLIVWDGDCGFCQASVAWLRRRDRRGRYADVPAQRCPSPPLTPAIMARTGREVVLVRRDGSVTGGADAVLEILSHTGWGALARLMARPPFIWALRAGYRWVASRRGWITRRFFRGQSCAIPTRKDPP